MSTSMMTEHEVRRWMRVIKASGDKPQRQVRMLLRLSRTLKGQLEEIEESRGASVDVTDPNKRAQLDRMFARRASLRNEIRAEARNLMQQPVLA